MKIGYAGRGDLEYLQENDQHVNAAIMERKVERKEVLVIRVDGSNVGWLRFGYFWDAIPFMNMLWIGEEYRGRGMGSALVMFWEHEMADRDHGMVMTSTLADERAQHFYRKLGYRDAGCLLLQGEAAELIFIKTME